MSDSPEKRDSVVFLHPQRRYTPAKDLQITFLRSSDLLPTTRDWIGLFRVGWTSSRDYYTFEWVPKPAQEKLQETVNFGGNRLPPEDGYFYQVCYVSRDGTVRGASAPFQFCQPATSIGPVDDLELVEVQEEGMSLMLLQHRSKEEVEQLRQDCQGQRAELNSVQASFAALRVEKETLAGQLGGVLTEKETLEGKVAERDARVEQLEVTLGQREARVKELATQLTEQEATLSAQLAIQSAQLVDTDRQVSDLNSQLQGLGQNLDREREQVRELLAVKSSEEGQIQLLQRKLEEEQVRSVAAKAEIADLMKELRIKDSQVDDLQRLAESHNEEIEQLTEKVDECMCKLEVERANVEDLQSEKMIECEQLQEEIATQKANVMELTGTNEMLIKKLEEAEGRPPVGPGSGKFVDKSVYEALRQAYDNMEEYYQTSEAKNHALRQKLQQSRDLVATLEGKCDELLVRIEKGKKAFEAVGLEVEQLKLKRQGGGSGEVADLQARVREMEETEEQLTQACGDAVRELSARKEEGKRQEMRIAELEQQLVQLQASYDQLEERHDAKVQEKNATLDQQQHVLDSKLAELGQLRPTCERLEVVKEELERELGQLEGEKQRISEQLREVTSERDALKLKLHQYKTQLQQVHAAAQSESQRTCPVCDTRFPARMTQDEYEKHVQMHFRD